MTNTPKNKNVKHAEDLAKDYELESFTPSAFFQYIVESLENGNRKQCKNLFNEMSDHSKQVFLTDFLTLSNGIEKSCLDICIIELIKGN